MRIRQAHATNFCSYKEVSFDYNNLGLTLIAGPTRAGKSTVLDLAAWAIFGVSSKELNADDVKSWSEEPLETHAEIVVETECEVYTITRIRGKTPTKNDLFFTTELDNTPRRGKDITDTQRLINSALGVDAELYLAASYVHQFTSDRFFTAKAKDRRETMEKIADLSLPIKLAERSSEARKAAKKDFDVKLQTKSKLTGSIESQKAILDDMRADRDKWNSDTEKSIAELQEKYDNYTTDKESRLFKYVDQLEELDKLIKPNEVYEKRLAQIREQLVLLDTIDGELKVAIAKQATLAANVKQLSSEIAKYNKKLGDTCPTCLGPANTGHREKHVVSLQIEKEPIEKELSAVEDNIKNLKEALSGRVKAQEAFQKCQEQTGENRRLIDRFKDIQAKAISLKEEVNPYAEQIEKLKSKVNPFLKSITANEAKLSSLVSEFNTISNDISKLENKINGLTWLYNKSYELRGILLEQAIEEINIQSNQILEQTFDAPIRIRLSLDGSDKLEVAITNEGYDCKYAQLSGGERAMLKLAFGLAYMQSAQNTAGIHISTLMLDEALNGLDADLKVKAYSLFESLSAKYDTVIVIDHSEELKQLFPKRFDVVKEGGYSRVQESI